MSVYAYPIIAGGIAAAVIFTIMSNWPRIRRINRKVWGRTGLSLDLIITLSIVWLIVGFTLWYNRDIEKQFYQYGANVTLLFMSFTTVLFVAWSIYNRPAKRRIRNKS